MKATTILVTAPPSGWNGGSSVLDIYLKDKKKSLDLIEEFDFKLLLEGVTAEEASIIIHEETSAIKRFWNCLKHAFPNKLDNQVKFCLSHLVPLLKNSSPEAPVQITLFGASRGAVLLVEVLNILLKRGLLAKSKGVSVRVFLDEPVPGNASLTLWLDFFEFSMAARALKGALQVFNQSNVESYVAYRSSGADNVFQKLFFKALPPPYTNEDLLTRSKQFFHVQGGKHTYTDYVTSLYETGVYAEQYERRLLKFLKGEAFTYKRSLEPNPGLPVKIPNRLLINGQELTAEGDIVAPKGFWGAVYYFMNIPYIAPFLVYTMLSSIFGLLSWTHTVSIVSMLPNWAMLQYISPVIVSIGSGASVALLIMTALYSLRWGLNCYKDYSERVFMESIEEEPITELSGSPASDLKEVQRCPSPIDNVSPAAHVDDKHTTGSCAPR
jgi:hypothetical protein